MLLAAATFTSGCAHTVGAVEVAGRAVVEFDCHADHLYVQTISRNHYAVAGCGSRAVFICRSGACERDSETMAVGDDSRAIMDGRAAHAALGAAREAVLECTEGESLIVEALFDLDGDPSLDFEAPRGKQRRQCIARVLGDIELEAGPEYPTYVRHVFSETPWAPAEFASVPHAEDEAAPEEDSSPEALEAPEVPVDAPVQADDAVTAGAADEPEAL
ncbi:MAG: hypothetical protein DRJ42_01435 [Deltaproteobacteria bacterium]|nr:MAG: hypothetical protein DRJ42_01435 [Deltaproteobacteria bacterium]